METTIKKAALIALLAFALLCIGHVELRDLPMGAWLTSMIGSKIIGIVAIVCFAILNKHWRIYEHEE